MKTLQSVEVLAETIAILMEIPDDRRIAEAYSRGQLIVDALPEYRGHFEQLWQAIARESGMRIVQ